MNVKEILNRITKDDVLLAITTFVNEPYIRPVKDKNVLIHEGREYQIRELINRASNREFERANDPKNFTVDRAKTKLKELGFEKFKDQKIMYKYYIKKASKQDVTKTTVLNTEAITQFFDVNIPNVEDTAIVSIKYLSDNITDDNVKIVRHQDPRIFIDRARFEEGDLLLFEKIGNGDFTLSVKKSNDSDYLVLNSSLKNNYLLTDVLPVNEPTPSLVNDLDEEYEGTIIKQPLNQILFGPPGTGKTYSTITKALNIIGLLQEKDRYTKEEYENAQELFQNELGKRIEFVTMHQSFSYEDFVQGLKPEKSEDGKGIVFDYKNGVFKKICKRAYDFNSGDDAQETEIYLSNKEILAIAFYLSKFNGKKKIEKKANDRLKYISDNQAFYEIGQIIGSNPNSLKNHRDKFDFMFNDRDDYTARNGWTPRNNVGVLDNTKNWPYNDVYNELNGKSFDEISNMVEGLLKKKEQLNIIIEGNNNHVIILDEINRANISRVFGELIALIEEDKRGGKLIATLPSGEPFTVPSNLFIIGTMNTADKSIALVDIALRRRFKFIPLYPNTNFLRTVLNENEVEQTEIETRVSLMTNLNKIIRAKKSVDFEIGHSYFMENDTLINILNNQVLPLLNEYFMYDLRKVKDIIEKTQNDKDGLKIPKLGISLNQNLWKERGLLEVERIDTIKEQKVDELYETDENNSGS